MPQFDGLTTLDEITTIKNDNGFVIVMSERYFVTLASAIEAMFDGMQDGVSHELRDLYVTTQTVLKSKEPVTASV